MHGSAISGNTFVERNSGADFGAGIVKRCAKVIFAPSGKRFLLDSTRAPLFFFLIFFLMVHACSVVEGQKSLSKRDAKRATATILFEVNP